MSEIPGLLLDKSFLTFVGGFLAALILCAVIAHYVMDLTQEKLSAFLDAIDEHKDDLAFAYIIVLVIGRSVIVSDATWVKIMSTGELSLLALAFGGGIGLSRAGKAYLKKRAEQSSEDES